MNNILKVVLVLIVVAFLFPKPYVSYPGYTTMEYAQQFEKTKKKCLGFSYLTNPDEASADNEGKSLCFGWLI